MAKLSKCDAIAAKHGLNDEEKSLLNNLLSTSQWDKLRQYKEDLTALSSDPKLKELGSTDLANKNKEEIKALKAKIRKELRARVKAMNVDIYEHMYTVSPTAGYKLRLMNDMLEKSSPRNSYFNKIFSPYSNDPNSLNAVKRFLRNKFESKINKESIYEALHIEESTRLNNPDEFKNLYKNEKISKQINELADVFNDIAKQEGLHEKFNVDKVPVYYDREKLRRAMASENGYKDLQKFFEDSYGKENISELVAKHYPTVKDVTNERAFRDIKTKLDRAESSELLNKLENLVPTDEHYGNFLSQYGSQSFTGNAIAYFNNRINRLALDRLGNINKYDLERDIHLTKEQKKLATYNLESTRGAYNASVHAKSWAQRNIGKPVSSVVHAARAASYIVFSAADRSFGRAANSLRDGSGVLTHTINLIPKTMYGFADTIHSITALRKNAGLKKEIFKYHTILKSLEEGFAESYMQKTGANSEHSFGIPGEKAVAGVYNWVNSGVHTVFEHVDTANRFAAVKDYTEYFRDLKGKQFSSLSKKDQTIMKERYNINASEWDNIRQIFKDIKDVDYLTSEKASNDTTAKLLASIEHKATLNANAGGIPYHAQKLANGLNSLYPGLGTILTSGWGFSINGLLSGFHSANYGLTGYGKAINTYKYASSVAMIGFVSNLVANTIAGALSSVDMEKIQEELSNPKAYIEALTGAFGRTITLGASMFPSGNWIHDNLAGSYSTPYISSVKNVLKGVGNFFDAAVDQDVEQLEKALISFGKAILPASSTFIGVLKQFNGE